MLGLRGVRLGMTVPEITCMQVRAIFTAAIDVARDGVAVLPEIMIPLVSTASELANQRGHIDRCAAEVFARTGAQIPYKVGTMIEVPRAALLAADIAEHADFFSLGTNDLTQMTFGLSRDDSARFLPEYLQTGVLADDLVQRFQREAAPALQAAGLLRLNVLRIGDGVAAAYYGLVHNDQAFFYLTGFDPAFAFESPGTIILAHAIEQALADGVRTFHFLRGQEPYKYEWGAVDRWNRRREFRAQSDVAAA